MAHQRKILVVLLALATQGAAHAGEIRLAGIQGASQVEVEDAEDEKILQALAERYGFEIRGIDNVASKDVSLGAFSGNLENVLKRLLRNRNYMIIHASDNSVKRVLILDAKVGSKTLYARNRPARDPDEEFLGALAGAF